MAKHKPRFSFQRFMVLSFDFNSILLDLQPCNSSQPTGLVLSGCSDFVFYFQQCNAHRTSSAHWHGRMPKSSFLNPISCSSSCNSKNKESAESPRGTLQNLLGQEEGNLNCLYVTFLPSPPGTARASSGTRWLSNAVMPRVVWAIVNEHCFLPAFSRSRWTLKGNHMVVQDVVILPQAELKLFLLLESPLERCSPEPRHQP